MGSKSERQHGEVGAALAAPRTRTLRSDVAPPSSARVCNLTGVFQYYLIVD